MIETPCNFDDVSSVRNREAALVDDTQSENEMQVRTQRVTDKADRQIAELREEIKEQLEKMMREVRECNQFPAEKIVNKLHRE